MRHPRASLVTMAALTLLGTAACGGDGDPAGERPAGATALYDKLPKAIKKEGVIRFAGDSHPPYRIVANDGKTVTGIDRELQEALGKALGVRTEISVVSGLPAALSGMLASRYDAFNGPVQDTAERERQFDAVVWMVTRTSYLIPKARSAGITSSADLCGKRIAATAGSIVEGQVKKLADWCGKQGKPAPVFVGLADTNGIILAAKSGRADVAGMTETAAIDAMAKEKDTYTYVSQTAEQGAGVDKLALLVPKAGGLGPVMFEAFKEIFKNGDYQKVMNKYGLQNVAVTQPEFNTAARS